MKGQHGQHPCRPAAGPMLTLRPGAPRPVQAEPSASCQAVMAMRSPAAGQRLAATVQVAQHSAASSGRTSILTAGQFKPQAKARASGIQFSCMACPLRPTHHGSQSSQQAPG